MQRLSFGIKTVPAEHNRIIYQILRDVPKTVVFWRQLFMEIQWKSAFQIYKLALDSWIILIYTLTWASARFLEKAFNF